MANMSYVRFQNTLRDLKECKIHINDDGLSNDEEKARKELIDICEEILDESGRLEKIIEEN